MDAPTEVDIDFHDKQHLNFASAQINRRVVEQRCYDTYDRCFVFCADGLISMPSLCVMLHVYAIHLYK